MRRTAYASYGYQKLRLERDIDIELKIGYNNQAFIMGNNDFFKHSLIRIIHGSKYQDVDPNTIAAQKGVAIVGDRATIFFTESKPCDVEIWIIDKNSCPSNAIVVESLGSYELEIDPRNHYDRFCIFPFTSNARDVHIDKGSGSGVTHIFTKNNNRYNCFGKSCDFSLGYPYYAVVEAGNSAIRLKAESDFIPQGNLACEHKYFAYMNITALAYPKLEAKTSVSCERKVEKNEEHIYGGNEDISYRRNNVRKYHFNDNSYYILIFFMIVIFVIIIVFLGTCCSSNCENDVHVNDIPRPHWHNTYYDHNDYYGPRPYRAHVFGDVFREANLLHREANLRRREDDLRRREQYNNLRREQYDNYRYDRTGYAGNTYTIPPRFETVTNMGDVDPAARVPSPPPYMTRAEPMRVVTEAPRRND